MARFVADSRAPGAPAIGVLARMKAVRLDAREVDSH